MSDEELHIGLLHAMLRYARKAANTRIAIGDLQEATANLPFKVTGPESLDFALARLERRKLISVVRAGNSGPVFVTLLPAAFDEAHEAHEAETNRDGLLSRLSFLYESRNDILKDGPSSAAGVEWFAEIASIIHDVEPKYSMRFRELADLLSLPLSSHSVSPLWSQLQQLISEVLHRLRRRSNDVSHAYGSGTQYDVFRDIRQIIGRATASVFLVEPYPSPDIFELYIDAISDKVETRLLIKHVPAGFEKIWNMYRAKPSVSLQVRVSQDIHDRLIVVDDSQVWVLGQSLKDAATKKPTYLVRIDEPALPRQYLPIWDNAKLLG